MEYRKELITTCKALMVADREIFTAALNLAMSGEFKEVNESFEIGDSFEFEWGYFENCADVNLAKLLETHHSISATLESLININNIKEEELDETKRG